MNLPDMISLQTHNTELASELANPAAHFYQGLLLREY